MPNHYTTALLVLELTIYALEAGTPNHYTTALLVL
jgi:hypothetical protein